MSFYEIIKKEFRQGFILPKSMMEAYGLTIFLTGATGFLGGKLLANLLQSTDHTLYVLVRDFERAEQAIRKLPDGAAARIRLFKGDITQENCGLSQADLKELQGNIDIVYHLAALVKFDEELRDELFLINYEGTKNVLRSEERRVGKEDRGK